MSANVRAVMTRSDLHGRIELALSLLAHRGHCPRCDPSLELIRLALAGANPEPESQNPEAV